MKLQELLTHYGMLDAVLNAEVGPQSHMDPPSPITISATLYHPGGLEIKIVAPFVDPSITATRHG